MTFEDSIQIEGKIYSDGYVEFGDRFYMVGDDGKPDTSRSYEYHKGRYDVNGNPINITDSYWIDFGKCCILPNTAAKIVILADGEKYQYSYEVYAPISKAKFLLIPKQGDNVRIIKKDGTINSEKEVKGFVTYKKRYLRLWL